MLAERKKKVKWTLNPRGNCWSRDANKFGQRMLEKMGWKSGEGLGVNKQGIKEHIKVAYKNDNKCLGYKDSGEEWVEHQSQFESLLAELSTSHSTAVAALDSDKVKIAQTETLEQRSRHSRTRVHYQKFTRGKDLSTYNEKDLKCILLGKQKVNNAAEESLHCDGNNEHFSSFYGIKTINSGNMNDYFEKLKHLQNDSGICSSDALFGEEEVSKKNNDGKHCYAIVNLKKKQKAEKQLSDTETVNMNSSETLNVEQQEKKEGEAPEQSYNANDNHPYTNCENQSVSEIKLKRYHITDHEGTVINNCCNEEIYCNEICNEKKPKKHKNDSIEDRECEVMEVDNEIEEVQVKKKHKKKMFNLVNENGETSVKDISGKPEISKDTVEYLALAAGDYVQVTKTKQKSRKKNPTLLGKEETQLVLVDCDSYKSKHAMDTELHSDKEVDSKQKKKKSKKKKQEFISEGIESSTLQAEDVLHSSENLNNAEEYFSTVETANEVGGKQLKKKSKKKKPKLLSECEETSLVPVDISHTLDTNHVEHCMGKNEEKLKCAHDVHISLESDLMAANINKSDHIVYSDNESRPKCRQTTEDVMPTKRKKKKNTEKNISVAENICKYLNDTSVEKKKHKRKKVEDENNINGQGGEQGLITKEHEKTNGDEELQNVVDCITGCSKSTEDENKAVELSKSYSESVVKSHERYSVDELKNMKSSLFIQLVDPRLIEFKGSNLHKIVGYGK